MNTENTPAPLKPEAYIAQAVQQIRNTTADHHITAMAEKWLPISVTDSTTLALAKEGRRELRNARLAVEDKRKELKEFPLQYGRAVDAEAKRITALLAPIATHLEAEIEKHEQAVRAQKMQAQAKRHGDLLASGWVLSGALYICGPKSVPAETAMAFTDEQMQAAVNYGRQEMERQQAERERIAAEQAAERAKAERLREEARRLQDEILAARREKILQHGATISGAMVSAVYGAPPIASMADVAAMTSEAFANLLSTITGIRNRYQQEIDKVQPAPEPVEDPVAPMVEVDPFEVLRRGVLNLLQQPYITRGTFAALIQQATPENVHRLQKISDPEMVDQLLYAQGGAAK